MKRTLLFLGLASVMSAFTGCTKDEVSDNTISPPRANSSNAPQTILAQVSEEGTRTALTPDGKSLVWKTDDELSVYSEAPEIKNLFYKLSGGAGTSVGEFTLQEEGTITAVPYGGYNKDNTPRMAYAAVYPSDQFFYNRDAPAGTPGAPVQIGGRVPETQTYTPGTFDPMAFPMLGLFKTDAAPLNLKFKYLAALVQMPLTGNQTITQIELTNLTSDTYSSLSGPVYYQFQAEGGLSAEDADAVFFGSEPFKFSDLGYFGNKSNSVKLAGNIALTPTAENFYLAVLPGQAYSSFGVTFAQADGSQIEKKIRRSKGTGILNPGEVISLPEMDLSSPYVAVPTVEGSKISWTPGDTKLVKSYSLAVKYVEAELFTLDNVTSGTDFSDKINKAMKPYVGSLVAPGATVNLSVAVKAEFNANESKTVATVSVPVLYSYTAPATSEIIAGVNAGGSYYYLFIDNMSAFGKVEYAVLKGDHMDKPEDFQAAAFQQVTSAASTNVGPLGDYLQTYTVMLKGYDAEKANVLTTKFLGWTVPLPSPNFSLSASYDPPFLPSYPDPAFDLTMSAQVQNYMSLFQVQSTGTLYWIEGIADVDKAKWDGPDVQHSEISVSFGMTSPMNFLAVNPAADGTKKYTFKLVITGTFPEGKTEHSGLGSYTPGRL